ncbi:putative elicitin [Plasmopara halstedii]
MDPKNLPRHLKDWLDNSRFHGQFSFLPPSLAMASLHNFFIVTLIALTALPAFIHAANCTSDEQSIVDNVYSELSSSSACGSLVADSGATSLDYCMKSDCLSVLSDAVRQLPDCTSDDEIDRMTGLRNVLAYCSDVNEVLDRSFSTSASGSDISSGPVSSGTSNVFVATGIMVTQLSVALYLIAVSV